MMETVGLHFSSEIHDEIKNMRRRYSSMWRHWSHGFQLGITVLLACGAVATFLWAGRQTGYEQKQSGNSGQKQIIAPPATNSAPKP
jgi:hypothetical protein